MSVQPDRPRRGQPVPVSRRSLGIVPHGNGHINDTYLVTCQRQGAPVRYILQHINRNVFHDPAAVMQNIERVTAHLAAQTAGQPDGDRRALKLVRRARRPQLV